VSGILALVVKLAGNYFLSERYGIRGLAAATVLVYAVNCMYFVVIAIRYRRSARSNTHGR
jgi:O-antigen/teichoic acid export membrane protein